MKLYKRKVIVLFFTSNMAIFSSASSCTNDRSTDKNKENQKEIKHKADRQPSDLNKDNQVKVTFEDVAGMKEGKEEVKEIVDFLKTPEKFTRLGGKMPKGILLVGPPGTGKTLLAKAVAGEAAVPFICLSGSDFVEMFVGIGPARVRGLFKIAKEIAPCIIFIDEIDAVGRARTKANISGANDERENTLNALLVAMDGFSTNAGVIVMAATNRPEVLDPALLRPGRFDKQISIGYPDLEERKDIIKYYNTKLKLDKDVQAKQLATLTPGYSGADLSNMCNEAALIAAKEDKASVTMKDFYGAIDRMIAGSEKKTKLIPRQEKKIIAYHEAGHAIAGWFLEHANPPVKVSIIPRGIATLGHTQYVLKEQLLYQKNQLLDQLAMILGGRAAEELIFGQISTGAVDDLEKATTLAYNMVTKYGMNDKVGPLFFHNSKQADHIFARPYSEKTAYTIDEAVKEIINDAYKVVKELLQAKIDTLHLLAKDLLAKETIFKSDLERLLGNPLAKASIEVSIQPSGQTNQKQEKSAILLTFRTKFLGFMFWLILV